MACWKRTPIGQAQGWAIDITINRTVPNGQLPIASLRILVGCPIVVLCHLPPQLQRGHVLALLLIFLAGFGALWMGQTSPTLSRITPSDLETSQSLISAKRSLVAYALSYADNYQPAGAGIGHMPCPDLDPIDDGITSNDGPDPPCGLHQRQIGRLPRQTFTFSSPDPTEAGSNVRDKRIAFYQEQSLRDQQLWYVVSSAFVNNPHSTVVNAATKGTLSVDGQDDVVAIVIAPGAALGRQHLSRPGDDLAYYLEDENADGDLVYSRKRTHSSNDRLIYITGSELSRLMEKRVVAIVVHWLEAFYHQHCRLDSECYPFAAEGTVCEQGRLSGRLPLLTGDCSRALSESGLLDETPIEQHWFPRNQWHTLIQYSLAAVCLQSINQPCLIDVSYGSEREDGLSMISVRPDLIDSNSVVGPWD